MLIAAASTYTLVPTATLAKHAKRGSGSANWAGAAVPLHRTLPRFSRVASGDRKLGLLAQAMMAMDTAGRVLSAFDAQGNKREAITLMKLAMHLNLF